VIAVVDDDASVRRSVANLLSSLGLRVTVFDSAESFLAADLAQIECLLLDVRLPKMSGLELLEKLRNMPVKLEVVMLTAHGDDDTRRRAHALGVSAFVTKPFRSEDLVMAIRARTADPA
jgi:FixJ family two-component response regulator